MEKEEVEVIFMPEFRTINVKARLCKIRLKIPPSVLNSSRSLPSSTLTTSSLASQAGRKLKEISIIVAQQLEALSKI
ncbi:CLUMA_CG019735, isoform A [Clunio marinus]|uniref:CLUMA_CG019735, isoform A n=1 Tax=Clunio marinus TaxID=568069 RepID=A0A1J1J487_9DIPT|nr:CLUMA_CG019735, isoform A [Clunio marinus]